MSGHEVSPRETQDPSVNALLRGFRERSGNIAGGGSASVAVLRQAMLELSQCEVRGSDSRHRARVQGVVHPSACVGRLMCTYGSISCALRWEYLQWRLGQR